MAARCWEQTPSIRNPVIVHCRLGFIKKASRSSWEISFGHLFSGNVTWQLSLSFDAASASSIIQFSFHDHFEAVPLSGQCGVTDGNFAVGMGLVGSCRRFCWGPSQNALNLNLVWIKIMFSPFHPFSFIHFRALPTPTVPTGGRLQPQFTQPGQRSGACCDNVLWCN